MALDANREDYQRLQLRFARSLDGMDPCMAARSFASFGHRFATDRDSLPQTDEDRAFHLVSRATAVIDYQLPFASDTEAATLIDKGHALLDEALSLDSRCHDAIRMREAASRPSFDAYLDFLLGEEEDVRKSCEERRDRALATGDGDRAALEAKLAVRPYLRWLSTEASRAVLCGRNRQAIRLGERTLELDPTDPSDVRFTMAIAYAKLEDEAGFEALMERERHLQLERPLLPADAWTALSRISLAYRRRDVGTAQDSLAALISAYPEATVTLALQRDIPDGVYARYAAPAFSADELIVAASECTVLTMEGRTDSTLGPLGSWIAGMAQALMTGDDRAAYLRALAPTAKGPAGGEA